MGIQDTDSEALRQLKSLQANNCRKIKPWLQSTGPKTPEGKKKAAKNLPIHGGKISRVVRNLEKLDEALGKIQLREVRSKKRQLATFQKLQKLAKKSLPEKSNG